MSVRFYTLLCVITGVFFVCLLRDSKTDRKREIRRYRANVRSTLSNIQNTLFCPVAVIVVEKMCLNWIEFIHIHAVHYVSFTSIESCNSIFNLINLCNVCWDFKFFSSFVIWIQTLHLFLYLWFQELYCGVQHSHTLLAYLLLTEFILSQEKKNSFAFIRSGSLIKYHCCCCVATTQWRRLILFITKIAMDQADKHKHIHTRMRWSLTFV